MWHTRLVSQTECQPCFLTEWTLLDHRAPSMHSVSFPLLCLMSLNILISYSFLLPVFPSRKQIQNNTDNSTTKEYLKNSQTSWASLRWQMGHWNRRGTTWRKEEVTGRAGEEGQKHVFSLKYGIWISLSVHLHIHDMKIRTVLEEGD